MVVLLLDSIQPACFRRLALSCLTPILLTRHLIHPSPQCRNERAPGDEALHSAFLELNRKFGLHDRSNPWETYSRGYVHPSSRRLSCCLVLFAKELLPYSSSFCSFAFSSLLPQLNSLLWYSNLLASPLFPLYSLLHYSDPASRFPFPPRLSLNGAIDSIAFSFL